MTRDNFISDLIALCAEHGVILSGEAYDEQTNIAFDVLASPRGATTAELVEWPTGEPGPEHIKNYGEAVDAKDPRAAVGTYPTGSVDTPLWKLRRADREFVRRNICRLIEAETDREAVRALNTLWVVLDASEG